MAWYGYEHTKRYIIPIPIQEKYRRPPWASRLMVNLVQTKSLWFCWFEFFPLILY